LPAFAPTGIAFTGTCLRVRDFLFRHVAKPEYRCRFAWRPGSMAFWNYRAALHRAIADDWPEKRVMHRMTIVEDTPGACGMALSGQCRASACETLESR